MKLSCQIIVFCAITANMSCAATPNTLQKREAAVLLNADKSNIRESIRIFVRQDAGRFVIADPDSLAYSSDMVVHRRASDFQSQSRTLPPANLDYRLVTDGTSQTMGPLESSIHPLTRTVAPSRLSGSSPSFSKRLRSRFAIAIVKSVL